MDKRTKRRMDKKVLDFERVCLFEMLIESDDENVKDALEQALIAVKLIHSEEIAEEVENHRQELIEEEKNKKNGLRDMERLIKEMERNENTWNKMKSHDYWDDNYVKRLGLTTDKWITTSTVSTVIDKTPKKVIIDPTTLLSKWSIKLDKK